MSTLRGIIKPLATILLIFFGGEYTSSAPGVQAYNMRDYDLPDVKYSPSNRVQLAGESIILPTIEGYSDVQSALGKECPKPRYRSRGLIAAGWTARGRWETDLFDPCYSRIKEISFFMIPSPGSPISLKEVDPQIYDRWKNKVESDAGARMLASQILPAVQKLTGSPEDLGQVMAVAGGDNEGFPFAAGKLRITDARDNSREFYFALAITVVGKTWVIPVIVADVKLENVSVSEDAIALAKATYHLNRDYRGPTRRKPDHSGPFLDPVP